MNQSRRRRARESIGRFVESSKEHKTLITAFIAIGIAASGWIVQFINTQTAKQIAQASLYKSNEATTQSAACSIESDASYKVLVERVNKLSAEVEAKRQLDDWQSLALQMFVSGGKRRLPPKPHIKQVPLSQITSKLPATPEAAAAAPLPAPTP